jgi:hypothetical protein
MYDALECLAVLDKTAAALSRLRFGTETVRGQVASALREFAARFQDPHCDPPGAAALLGAVFWMRRMDAVQRQFAREIAALPSEIITQK